MELSRDGQELIIRVPFKLICEPQVIIKGLMGIRRGLTPQQEEILKGILEGKPDKVIAGDVFKSIRTVKFHVSNILHHFGVESRRDLQLKLIPESAMKLLQ